MFYSQKYSIYSTDEIKFKQSVQFMDLFCQLLNLGETNCETIKK